MDKENVRARLIEVRAKLKDSQLASFELARMPRKNAIDYEKLETLHDYQSRLEAEIDGLVEDLNPGLAD